ncbi:hypothetical protein [Paraburkholderia tropica]|uniref:hypothetical protein n=1 Tax=Paraburkholderia tropica TaxID=92647 RepID=UPI001CC49F19|nr:hypothetical protein [Paraburkholderia tropica]
MREFTELLLLLDLVCLLMTYFVYFQFCETGDTTLAHVAHTIVLGVCLFNVFGIAMFWQLERKNDW